MQIAPGLYSMSQWKGGHVHAYLVDDGGSLTLIDTLFNTDASVVLDEIARAGKQITDLKHIIITHAHRSHVGGVATLKNLSRARVYSHEWEEGIIAGQRKATSVRLLAEAAAPGVLSATRSGPRSRSSCCLPGRPGTEGRRTSWTVGNCLRPRAYARMFGLLLAKPAGADRRGRRGHMAIHCARVAWPDVG